MSANWTAEARQRLSKSMKKAWRRRHKKELPTDVSVLADVHKAINQRRAIDAEIKRRVESLGFSIQ